MRAAIAWGSVLLALFLSLGLWVQARAPGLDTAISTAFAGLWREPVGDITFVVTAILGPVLPVVAFAVMVGAAVWAWRRGESRVLSVLLRAMVVLAACRMVSLFKGVFERVRPRDYPDWSFPSGHVVSVASVAFTGIVVCAWLAGHLLRRVIEIAAVAVVVAALCRVLLDVHWVTDVLGGILGVTGIGLLVAVMVRLLPVRPVRRRVGE